MSLIMKIKNDNNKSSGKAIKQKLLEFGAEFIGIEEYSAEIDKENDENKESKKKKG